jgi:hypothetical protein
MSKSATPLWVATISPLPSRFALTLITICGMG